MAVGYVRPDGYREVWLPGGKRKALEHRVVMGRVLGRQLLRSEQVHHRDGTRLNNVPDNLEVVDGRLHRRVYHVTTFRDETQKQCTRCRETKPRAQFAAVKGHGDPHHTQCKQCLALAARKRRLGRPTRLGARKY